jgi:hypothetical protein
VIPRRRPWPIGLGLCGLRPFALDRGNPLSLYPASPGRCGVRTALPAVSSALPVAPLFALSSLLKALLLLLKVLLSLLKVLLSLLAHALLLPSGSRSRQRTLPWKTGGQSSPGRGILRGVPAFKLVVQIADYK